jgi:hypothetical protein
MVFIEGQRWWDDSQELEMGFRKCETVKEAIRV